MCPLVSGLPPQEGESILERLSEIARAAKVPLASEHCRANLYVLVTTQPEALLRAMETRNRLFTFGDDALPGVVDQFIATPRPVRVWYDSDMMTPEGRHLSRHPPPQIEVISRLQFGIIWAMSRVFIVVDEHRLRGVSRQQLAAGSDHAEHGARNRPLARVYRVGAENDDPGPVFTAYGGHGSV